MAETCEAQLKTMKNMTGNAFSRTRIRQTPLIRRTDPTIRWTDRELDVKVPKKNWFRARPVSEFLIFLGACSLSASVFL